MIAVAPTFVVLPDDGASSSRRAVDRPPGRAQIALAADDV
jgi:hypothetical protein